MLKTTSFLASWQVHVVSTHMLVYQVDLYETSVCNNITSVQRLMKVFMLLFYVQRGWLLLLLSDAGISFLLFYKGRAVVKYHLPGKHTRH